VKDLQKNYGGVAVLKGVGTPPQGEEASCKLLHRGNPGMASGGMGDVLSGIIGGFLAQGLSMQEAAELGVMVHAMAADRAAAEGGERGLLASDLMKHLRAIVNPDE
jgi:NAD(P)H-hydrate epimerase